MAQKQDVTAGILVHFVQENDTHSAAVVTSVVDGENNVVTLFIMRDDRIIENYTRRGIAYSETYEAGTWHFIEGHPTWKKKD